MKNLNPCSFSFKNPHLNGLMLIAILILLPCCNARMVKFRGADKQFKDTLKKASPDFRQGWYDGCESGIASASNTFYAMFYKNNKVDGYKMAHSSDYRTAWNNAFVYCVRFEYINQKESIFENTFGGYR